MLGSASDVANVKKEIEDGFKKEGINIVQITKTKEINDWKIGDHVKTKVGKNWYITAKKAYQLLDWITKQYYLDDELSFLIPYKDTEDIDLENIDDTIYEGMNIFVWIVMHSPGQAGLGSVFGIKDLSDKMCMAVIVIEAEPEVIDVTGVTISSNNKDFTSQDGVLMVGELKVGEKANLTATVTPSNATNKEVTWKSATPSVATVSNNGEITALKEGTSTITAKAGTYIAVCRLTVKNKEIEVTSIEITGKNELTEGSSTKLNAKILPNDATDKTITWTSSNKEIATVDTEGKVEGKKAGEVTITATATNGVKKNFTIKVSEKEEPPVNNIIPDDDDDRTQTLVGKLFTYLRKILSKAFESLKKIFKK